MGVVMFVNHKSRFCYPFFGRCDTQVGTVAQILDVVYISALATLRKPNTHLT